MINAQKEPDPVKRKKFYVIAARNMAASNTWIYLGNAPAPAFADPKYDGFIVRTSTELDVHHVWKQQT